MIKMLNQKLTSGLIPLFKKACTLFLPCLLLFFILNSCMLVRFDAHLATKGTRLEKEEVQPGPPIEGSYVKDWAHIKDCEDNPDVGYAGYVFNPMTRKLEYCRNRMATGWMAGALYGYRIKKIKSMNMNVFAGAYLMHLGDFKSQQDIKTKEDYFNLHFKAGVELALPYSIK